MTKAGKNRCTVCGKEFEGGSICPACEAMIRGEAVDKHKQIRKEAEKEFHKEGVDPTNKK